MEKNELSESQYEAVNALSASDKKKDHNALL